MVTKKFREVFEFLAFGDTEGVKRVRVRIRSITSLGFENKRVYTQAGTFKEFEKIGYVEIKFENTRYKTSKYVVRDFINMYKPYIEILNKEEVIDFRNGKVVKGYNWEYQFKNLPEPAKKPVKIRKNAKKNAK
jgi:hypothetical protein